MKKRACPKCRGTLADVEQHGVQYETCSSCNGLWFDSLALDILFRERSAVKSLGASEDFKEE
jgi:Zn-finger nucleic acid-binding protein